MENAKSFISSFKLSLGAKLAIGAGTLVGGVILGVALSRYMGGVPIDIMSIAGTLDSNADAIKELSRRVSVLTDISNGLVDSVDASGDIMKTIRF